MTLLGAYIVGEQGDQNPKIGFATPQPLFGQCWVSPITDFYNLQRLLRAYFRPCLDETSRGMSE